VEDVCPHDLVGGVAGRGEIANPLGGPHAELPADAARAGCQRAVAALELIGERRA
jgi:hypothetical protein